jgi:hypothetical protein
MSKGAWIGLAVAAVIIVVLAVVLVVVLAGDDEEQEAGDEVTTTAVPTTEAETTTTQAETTTTAAETTTTEAETTTTETETTTTTSEAETTTTEAQTTSTTEAEPAVVLGWSGIGVAELGGDPDAVVAAVAEELGPPEFDSGWAPHPIFDDAEYRSVQWGDGFFLWFGDNASPYGEDGVRHFQMYEYFGSPEGLATEEDVGVGDPVGDLLAAYGDQAELVLNALTQQGYRYQIHTDGTDDYLCFDVGFDEPADSTPIESIWAGRECTYGGE